ncbi:MAG: phosphoribosyltransferase [Nitrospirae bacterium]|nr:phosphoribosyltransferase [Nitrospirota bacterium]MCL5977901.1 phosphoribosyltransferase [Nitrospirota bacterium]
MPLPSKERFRCEILSWNRVVRDTKKLSKNIKDSGYKPDIVAAIGRGGYVPARILCDYLLMRDLASIKVEHWGIAATETEKAVIKFPLCADIKNKKVLLVDDITDTGDTLRVSMEYLKTFEPEDIKTAVLIHKTCSAIMPDYFVSKITKWRWIIFPWHIYEDLTGFVKRIKDMGIHSEEDITRELRERYNIIVDIDTIKDVLLELF